MAGLTPAPANPQPLNFGGVNLRPDFDPIEILPPAAAEKLRLLRQRREDAHAIIPEFEQVRQASLARVEAANALKRLTDHPQDGGFYLPDDDRRVIEAQRTLDKATADLARLNERSERTTAGWQAASGATAAVETYLRDGRPGNTVFEVVEVEPPKLAKGDDIFSALDKVRRRGRELKADLHRIRSAPYPSSHAKAQMRAQVAVLAARGAPSVSRLVELDGQIDFQTTRMQSQIYNVATPAIAFSEATDVVALVAWLHKDALIAALNREIDAEADDPASLSVADRQTRESEVLSDLLEIERQEAALVWRAQSEKLPVEHRADIDPRALLGVRLITAPRATVPETSPGQSWVVRR